MENNKKKYIKPNNDKIHYTPLKNSTCIIDKCSNKLPGTYLNIHLYKNIYNYYICKKSDINYEKNIKTTQILNYTDQK